MTSQPFTQVELALIEQAIVAGKVTRTELPIPEDPDELARKLTRLEQEQRAKERAGQSLDPDELRLKELRPRAQADRRTQM